MDDFPIDWLGRCGPFYLNVRLSLEEVVERLQMSVVTPGYLEVHTTPRTRRFTGDIHEDRFTIRAIMNWERACPILAGRIEAIDGGTRIRFQIHRDHKVVVFPVVGFSGIAIVSVWLAFATGNWLFYWLPAFPPFAIGANIWLSRRETYHLRTFFLGLFEGEEVAP